MKKNFFGLGLFWVLRAALAGFIYATTAFFTKESWEKWKSKNKNYFIE
jgi:hypothetical protein